jgi:hypothetical protein
MLAWVLQLILRHRIQGPIIMDDVRPARGADPATQNLFLNAAQLTGVLPMSFSRPRPTGFPLEIKPAFDQLQEDMVGLSWKLELYRTGFLDEGNRDVLFAQTETAFSIIQSSLEVDITLSVARLMDPPTQMQGKRLNLTLRHLFELIEAHGNAKELLAKITGRYQSLESLLGPIQGLRNTVMAHRDRPTAYGHKAPLPISPDGIVQVCREFQGILNDIDGHFAGSETAYQTLLSISNIEAVVSLLRRGMQGFEEDWQRELDKWRKPGD